MATSDVAGTVTFTGWLYPVEVIDAETFTEPIASDELALANRPELSVVTVSGIVVGSVVEPAACAFMWGRWSSRLVVVELPEVEVDVTVASGLEVGCEVAQAIATGTLPSATESLLHAAPAVAG